MSGEVAAITVATAVAAVEILESSSNGAPRAAANETADPRLEEHAGEKC